jgi:hypothetical protein
MDAEEDRYAFFRQAGYEAHRDFDKAIMSLSAGALGVSIAFVHSIAPDPRLTVFLRIAWVAFERPRKARKSAALGQTRVERT